MNPAQVRQIIEHRAVPHPTAELRLIETHISWVLMGDAHVYKIKKPLRLSFLDFSELSERKVNCEREVRLNRRLAPEMYLGILPVRVADDGPGIGQAQGTVIDYAVHMRRMDETRQLDVLLESGQVAVSSMVSLAQILAGFHKGAPIITEAEDWEETYEEFRDLQSVLKTLADLVGPADGDRLRMVIGNCSKFLRGLGDRIEARKESGFVKDGHGDLHCRNILLTEPPVVFDCIEFSEQLRTLDVLSELGFLCMDLERFGRPDLAGVLMQTYLKSYPCMELPEDHKLFMYYKMYRANVRMKVEALALDKDSFAELPDSEAPVRRIREYCSLFMKYAEGLGLLSG